MKKPSVRLSEHRSHARAGSHGSISTAEEILSLTPITPILSSVEEANALETAIIQGPYAGRAVNAVSSDQEIRAKGPEALSMSVWARFADGCRRFDSRRALARHVGASQNTVNHWFTRGYTPDPKWGIFELSATDPLALADR